MKPTNQQIEKIIKQMRDEGLQFEDEIADYFHGEQRIYAYDEKKNTFIAIKTDTIAASYMKNIKISEEELRKIISEIDLKDFQDQGFKT